MDTEVGEPSKEDTPIELCKFYGVKMFSTGGFRALCSKGQYRPGVKCHSERRGRGCGGYEPSRR